MGCSSQYLPGCGTEPFPTKEDQAKAGDVDKVITYALSSYKGAGGIERMGALTSFIVQLAIEKPDSPMTRSPAALSFRRSSATDSGGSMQKLMAEGCTRTSRSSMATP
jgi:hypothetical protein